MAYTDFDSHNGNKYLLAGISRPELLNIRAGQLDFFGCDQDWYPDSWQQRAGCGPCTASSILLYMALLNPALRPLYPHKSASRDNFPHFMQKIWSHVTPGIMGVNEGQIFIDGLSGYAREMNIRLEADLLKIPGRHQVRPAWPALVEFVRTGLAADCPVAFLNLSNGDLPNLDSWHWVAITALWHLPNGDISAVISDSGERKFINLRKWFDSTLLGGALVAISRAAPLGSGD